MARPRHHLLHHFAPRHSGHRGRPQDRVGELIQVEQRAIPEVDRGYLLSGGLESVARVEGLFHFACARMTVRRLDRETAVDVAHVGNSRTRRGGSPGTAERERRDARQDREQQCKAQALMTTHVTPTPVEDTAYYTATPHGCQDA